MNDLPSVSDKPKDMLRAIRILCAALMIGCSLFAIVSIAVNLFSDNISAIEGQENIFLSVAAVIAAVCLVTAWRGYNKAITNAKESLIPLPSKLNLYRIALIRYMALCEGPAILGIMFFFLSGYYIMLLITIVMLSAMLLKFPRTAQVAEELALNWQEKAELE